MRLAKCKDAEVAVESVIILGWRGEFLDLRCISQCGYLAAARVFGWWRLFVSLGWDIVWDPFVSVFGWRALTVIVVFESPGRWFW
jgi:hypothetical protein